MKPVTFIISFILGSLIGIVGFLFVVKNNLIDTSYRAYVVTSGSMEPAIKTGSIIVTKAKPSYKIGDIVTFKNNGNVVTHRIMGMDEGSITTKGDANSSPDFTATARDDIIGRSFIIVPYVGWVIDFAKTPRGFVALIVIPASIIIYEELKSLLRETKKIIGKVRFTKNTNYSPFGALLMLAGILLLGGAGLRLVGVTQSNYLDRVDFVGNSFQAADVYDENATPSPTPTSNPTPVVLQSIVINEFYAYSSEDWIELYNPNSQTINISGWTLDDANTSSDMHEFPENAQISANSFIIANVGTRLNKNGDTITLYDNDANLIDEITYYSTTDGVSKGRHPDGGDWYECLEPSKGLSNIGVCQL